MSVDISPQGNANSTAARNVLYSGTTVAPVDLKVTDPLVLQEIVLTGKDGVSKPISQHLTGRVKSGKRTRTIEGSSTVEITFSDVDRGVLRSPVLTTGLPSVSSVATALLNDVNTVGVVAPDNSSLEVGGSTYGSQVPNAPAANDEVTRNKQLVVQIGVNRKLPREAVVIAMMTMLDESGGVNVLTPDSNGSSGIMQQTPSQGWGTREQVNNPVYAINTFYDRLLAESNWANLDPWVAAQKVQRSAWTGNPNSNNNFSSEVGGNYHLVYDRALQEVQGYRPQHDTVLNTQVLNNRKGIVSLSQMATATLTYRGIDYSLVRVQTSGSDTTLTFEDSLIVQLKRNRSPYSSSSPTSIPLFVNALLRQDGFNPHFVQQGLVVNRVDPTQALNAGLSDPATLANFEQLLATDGARGTGTLRVLTKFASVNAAASVKNAQGTYDTVSTDGLVQDSWTTITGLVAPLRWLAMSDGQDFYIGSEEYVSHYIDKPVIRLTEHQDGVEWLSGEFDLGTETSNQLSFVMTAPFVGVPAQRVVINDMGLLSGIWIVYSIEETLGTVQSTVTLQRIQADLEDAEHQAATDKLLATGGGISTVNNGVLSGSRPQVTGQVSQNGWASGDSTRAGVSTFKVPGTSVSLALNKVAGPLLVYVAQQFAQRVEPLDPGQCGGYNDRHIAGNAAVWSNHSSGTAIDLNSTLHPQGARTMTADQIDAVHAICSSLNGAVRWGGDYRTGLLDQMHFEINTDEQGVQVALAQIGPYATIGQGHTTGGH